MTHRDQALLAACLALALGLAPLLPGLPVIAGQFMVDDSFYYLQIARNAALGRGFTFDGLHATNGFQPLFQLMLVPIFKLPVNSVTAIYIEKILEALVFAATAALVLALGKRISGSTFGGWMGLLILFMPGPLLHPIGKGLFTGMESGIDALMVATVLLIALDVNRQPRSMRFMAFYGLAMGLLFLARVDNAFLIAGLGCWHLWELRHNRGPRPGQLLAAATVGLAMAAAYLTWNALGFGGIVPVSGEVKLWLSSERSAELLAQGWIPWAKNTLWFIFSGKAVGVLPLAGLLAVPALRAGKQVLRRWDVGLYRDGDQPLLTLLWIASLAKIGYYSVFQQFPQNNFFWYYVQELLTLSVCAACLGGALWKRWPRPAGGWPGRGVFAGLYALSLLGIATSRPIFEWELASLAAVPEIESRVGPDAVIGSKDAGVLGYFLPNPVVHLGGLVNDREFFEYLRSGRLADYVRKERIDYLANLVEPGNGNHFTANLGSERLKLIYEADRPVAAPAGWRYKLYRVQP